MATQEPATQSDLPETHPPTRGYSVLSFDGGPVVVYTSLLMLKDLLRHKIPQGPIYPYQYFDLICGTSTGGFAAILLGVLDLEIDDAISTYLNLMKVCEESLRSWWWARDSRKTLTVAIQAILEKHGYKDKLMADDSRKGKCKCFVTTGTPGGEQGPIRLIRSYEDPQKEGWAHPWTILDAALATFGAPVYFRSHNIPHEKEIHRYEDARFHGMNNPAIAAWDECDRLDPNNSPYCIVSLGSAPPTISEPPTGTSHWIFSALKAPWAASATANSLLDAMGGMYNNEIHEKMVRLTRKLDPKPYFRFAPDLGAMRNISLSDESSVGKLATVVNKYPTKDSANTFEDCTARLFP